MNESVEAPAQRKVAGYGWRKDLPDRRDHVVSLGRGLASAWPAPPYPDVVDLRVKCPPIYDQGDLGSCTANAIAAAMQFDQAKEGLPPFTPSRLFIYYNERVIEHTTQSDAGAEIRDGIKSVFKQGSCSEEDWPYVDSALTVKPGSGAYKEALGHIATEYARVPQSAAMMQSCLTAGLPFVFGFTVYESFETDAVVTSGVVPMPGPDEAVLGGHAVLAVGYNVTDGTLLCRNSWGTSWGMAGYFTMPFAYVTDANLASDFWRVAFVKSTAETT